MASTCFLARISLSQTLASLSIKLLVEFALVFTSALACSILVFTSARALVTIWSILFLAS
jgi:hypothetical protein